MGTYDVSGIKARMRVLTEEPSYAGGSATSEGRAGERQDGGRGLG